MLSMVWSADFLAPLLGKTSMGLRFDYLQNTENRKAQQFLIEAQANHQI